MAPSAPAVHSVTDLLARAIGIEREAADRYAEFARFMQDRGRDELADLFAQLARLEHDHARVIEEWLGEVNPPVPVEAAFHWLESGPPSPAAHEWLLRLMGPRDALAIALSDACAGRPRSSRMRSIPRTGSMARSSTAAPRPRASHTTLAQVCMP